jgi:nucleoside 2-deoxyribosyltransferase
MYRELIEKRLASTGLCPICDSPCYQRSDQTDSKLVICPTCGKFRFGSGADIFFRDPLTQQIGYKFSYYLRSISERTLGKRDNSLFPVYSEDEFEKIAESRDPSVREKLQLLLRYLASLSDFPGQQMEFDPNHDYSVLSAKNEAEAIFYLHTLEDRGLASVNWGLNNTAFTLTSKGWEELERIEQSGAESSSAFIAMWFDATQDDVNKSIQSAIVAAGYAPIRIDEIEHVNRIDDEIIARIRQSKFLIADFTGQRNGVYFEAGFMLGLGRPVIWLCGESDLDKVHFDARQYNTIVYSDVEKLKSKLQFRIEAIMGKGPMSH